MLFFQLSSDFTESLALDEPVRAGTLAVCAVKTVWRVLPEAFVSEGKIVGDRSDFKMGSSKIQPHIVWHSKLAFLSFLPSFFDRSLFRFFHLSTSLLFLFHSNFIDIIFFIEYVNNDSRSVQTIKMLDVCNLRLRPHFFYYTSIIQIRIFLQHFSFLLLPISLNKENILSWVYLNINHSINHFINQHAHQSINQRIHYSIH